MGHAPQLARSEVLVGGIASTVRVTASGRPVAAGGWRRALVGVVVGAVAGAAVLVARRSPRSR